MRHALSAAVALLATILLPAAAFAVEGAGLGSIHPGGFPTPVGPVASEIGHIYNVIFIIVAVVFAVVSGGLGWILYRYRHTRVEKPATFSHHTGLEVLWTVIPALICVFIAWEGYRVMKVVRTMPEDGINVEAVAYQFGWDFFYPDFSESGTHVAAAEPTAVDEGLSSAGEERRVKELVVPVGVPVKVQVTAADVIHAFYAPNLGVKVDAVPGRINYTWFQADKPGKYLGQCAELCGSAHGEMFFYVTAVSPEEFATYIKQQRVAAGLTPEPVPAEAVSADVVSGSAITTTGVSATGEALAPVLEVSPTE